MVTLKRIHGWLFRHIGLLQRPQGATIEEMAITMGWQGTRAWNDLGRAEEKAAEPIRPWTCELMIPQVMVADTHIKGTREQQR